MRIIGKDGQEYKSEKECLIADKKYDEAIKLAQEKKEQERREIEEKIAEEKALYNQKKKEAAKAVEDANAKLEEARKVYGVARKKAEDILRAANKEAEDILLVAAKEMEKASEERMNAVAKFTKDYGVYKTVLTGNDAVDEYNRIVDNINSVFNKVFPGRWF